MLVSRKAICIVLNEIELLLQSFVDDL